MEITAVAGATLMGLGVLLFLVAAVRTVTNDWTFGVYEVWIWPLAATALLLLGRWLV
jgi:hypothetical protein